MGKTVKFPDIENLSEKCNEAAEYISMYPNVLLGVHRDHAFAIIKFPKDQKTTESVHLLYPKKDIDRALQKRIQVNGKIYSKKTSLL